jgi:nucleotide-binding universal stress UspA family protein
MKSLVVPIGEGRDSKWAVDYVIELYRQEAPQVHLLNVQTPLPLYVTRFLNKQTVGEFHRENGMRTLQNAIERLDAAGVPHTDHVLVGRKAETIARFAREQRCDRIVLPKREAGLVSSLGLGSIGTQVRQLIGAGDQCDICEVY